MQWPCAKLDQKKSSVPTTGVYWDTKRFQNLHNLCSTVYPVIIELNLGSDNRSVGIPCVFHNLCSTLPINLSPMIIELDLAFENITSSLESKSRNPAFKLQFQEYYDQTWSLKLASCCNLTRQVETVNQICAVKVSGVVINLKCIPLVSPVLSDWVADLVAGPFRTRGRRSEHVTVPCLWHSFRQRRHVVTFLFYVILYFTVQALDVVNGISNTFIPGKKKIITGLAK